MTSIRTPNDFCTVIVTVDAPSHVIEEMEPHARNGLTYFADMKGFVSGALHKSTDGKRLVQYLQWETEANHLACMDDSRWDDLPSTRTFMAHVESGAAKIDVRIYDVAAATETQ